MPQRKRHPGFFSCPHCGAQVRRDAAACRECGSDAETGWSDEEHADGGYAQDDDFDYDEYVRREFPDDADGPPRRTPWQWIVAIVAVLLIVAMLVFW
jgi:hypothetical protein